MKTTDHFLHTTTLPSLYLPSSVAYGLNSKAWSESGTFNIFFFLGNRGATGPDLITSLASKRSHTASAYGALGGQDFWAKRV